MIPQNTEEAYEIGKKLSRTEAVTHWEEYKRSLKVSQKQRLNYLKDCERGFSNPEFPKAILKKSFREQMLREMLEGYLGATTYSLTADRIEFLLKQRRHYGTVSDFTDRKSL
jgi:hypothetical protein